MNKVYEFEKCPKFRKPTVGDIEAAMSELLTAYLDSKRNPRDPRPWSPEAVSLREVPTGATADLHALVSNPIAASHRSAMRRLAQHLHDFLKQEMRVDDPVREMLKSLENIAARDPDQEGRRGATLDKLFDGIGDETDRWMA